MRRFAWLFLLPPILLAGAAEATPQGQLALQRFHQMDLCARQAQAAFPSYTAKMNAERDAALRLCLEGQNLPPRALLSPPQAH